jgi:hypothetical protein
MKLPKFLPKLNPFSVLSIFSLVKGRRKEGFRLGLLALLVVSLFQFIPKILWFSFKRRDLLKLSCI